MSDITAILTGFRRPHALAPQFEAVSNQTVLPASVWLWANSPDVVMQDEMVTLTLDRVVTCSDNAGVHARFALALTASTEFVAVFDDDTIPGTKWFENCLQTMQRQPGILGSAGVILQDRGYAKRTLHGWHAPGDEIVEVDLVGHTWFLRTEWLKYLFSAPATSETNGEDIELSARAWRLGGIRTFCPPHPHGDKDRWGSLKGISLGSDLSAASRRPSHLAERDQIVTREIDSGWLPLFLRPNSPKAAAEARPPRKRPGESAQEATQTEANSASRKVAASSKGSPSDSSLGSFVLGSLPPQTRDVLVLGSDVGELAELLRRPGRIHVTNLELDDIRHARHDKIKGTDLDFENAIEKTLSRGPFDLILCKDVLARQREPAKLLRRCHDLLSNGGLLVLTAPNIRRHATITALLYGTWPHRADGLLPDDPIRFFTRRELEKLLFRSGFAVDEVEYLGNGELAAWRDKGRRGEIKTEQIHIAGLREQDAEEFHAEGFAIRAKRRMPVEYGLTSIVLITHNQLPYTRGCLESIRFHTDEPFELIVVDNGSTDGTVEYLRACRDVHVIDNAENRGFPAAANQGIGVSKGDQVVLLNNDTLVTTGWLERMLFALQSDPNVGLVGPSSNYVSGQQQVAVSYQDLMDLDGFAWEWGKMHGRVRLDVDRLVGFCLLIRRALVDAIGLLDERFGIGNFEDDDYCVRARQAGFRAVFAKDAFVHHFGHRTFDAVGADLNAVLRENAHRFHAKWSAQGEVVPIRTDVASPAQESIRPTFGMRAAEEGGLLLVRKMATLSLCMIVRDNERTIRPCLESIRPWVDEMIVVDTGSNDRTPEICRELGAKVYEFAWCDDFSAARNECPICGNLVPLERLKR